MPQLRSAARARLRAGSWATVLLLVTTPLIAREVARALQLEVVLNDAPTKLIGTFLSIDGRRIGARRDELEEIGIRPASGGKSPADFIFLDDTQGLSYRYDVPAQRIFITVPDARQAPKTYSAAPSAPKVIAPQVDLGAVLNYNLFASSSSSLDRPSFLFGGLSATLDGRIFSPFGTLSQSGILRTSDFSGAEALRLDTAFTYSDAPKLNTYRAGDAVTSGFAWTAVLCRTARTASRPSPLNSCSTASTSASVGNEGS